jgi:ligand-binding SRPBCC domain-containing protein
MLVHMLETDQWVPSPLERVFPFFADARNLERITPPQLRFRILTPQPIEMAEGTLIDYALRMDGIPMRWRSRIDRWEPGRAFVDRQLSGPYARWIHTHTFEAEDGGTRVRDRVEYALPLDPLTRPMHAWLVRPRLERIFGHRNDVIAGEFGRDPAGRVREPLKFSLAPAGR